MKRDGADGRDSLLNAASGKIGRMRIMADEVVSALLYNLAVPWSKLLLVKEHAMLILN